MSESRRGPAYRIETARLVLRCYAPTDARLVVEAITSSLDHLRPWMPWAEREPESVAAKAARLREFRGKFDLGMDFAYGIFDRTETRVLGSCGLHTRLGPDALEIGYWIHQDSIRQGLGTEMAAALTRVGFELHPVDRIEIRCEPTNAASAGVPHKLGYRHEATLPRRLRSGDDSAAKLRDAMIWTLYRSELPASPVERLAADIQAFDVIGERLL